ncbi:MAG: hypothetical protein V1720_18210 [bacterium]
MPARRSVFYGDGAHYACPAYPDVKSGEDGDPADEFHSPYCYVGNNPVNLIDPDGRQVNRVTMDLITQYYLYNTPEPIAFEYELPTIIIEAERVARPVEYVKGPILTIGFGASYAGGLGANYFIGYNINLKNGYMNTFASWGLSAGLGSNYGPSVQLRPNSSLASANGWGSKLTSSKNSYDITISNYTFIIKNPSRKSLDLEGGGYSIFNPGTGTSMPYVGFDFTFQTSWGNPQKIK